MYVQPDAVSGPVAEPVAVPHLHDHLRGGSMELGGFHTGPDRVDTRLPGRDDQFVHMPVLLIGLADPDGPSKVRATTGNVSRLQVGDPDLATEKPQVAGCIDATPDRDRSNDQGCSVRIMSVMADNSHPTVSEVLAERVSRSRPSDLPSQALEVAKIFILDTIGVGLAGARTSESRSLVETLRTWAGTGAASVWGRNLSLPPWVAAMANSHQAHCLEFDCVHEPAVIHPLTVVLSCAIAEVQSRARRGEKTSGAELITGVALGVEIASGLGAATTTALRFFRPCTNGLWGGVAAVA